MLNSTSIARETSRVFLHQLGEGAHGRVDLAVDLLPRGLVRLVVVKRLLPGYSKEQEERFLREARISLRISHQCIAKTIDVEVIAGELGIVQEYVAGVTLSLLTSHSKGFQIKVDLALYIGAEVARALAYLHGFDDGVLHRDVTPDNILLSYNGAVKLVDFGIAKELRADATALTEIGNFAGQAIYSAPEVLAGRLPTPESDIYSLGVVLWQTLTGRPVSVVAGPVPPPSTFNPGSSRFLDELVLRCLSTDPRARLSDAMELHLELRRLLPPAFIGERALAGCLRAHFNVDGNNRDLADDVERIRSEFAQAPSKAPPHAKSARHARRWKVGLPAFVGGAVLATGAAVALRIVAHERNSQIPRESGMAPLPGGTPTSALSSRPVTSVPTAVGFAAAAEEPLVVPQPVESSTTAPNEPPDESVTPRRGRKGDGRVASGAQKLQPAQGKVAQLLERGRSEIVTGNYATAKALASRALLLGAGGEAHLILGIVYQFQGRFGDAEREFTQSSGPEAEQHLVAVRKVLEDLGAKQ